LAQVAVSSVPTTVGRLLAPNRCPPMLGAACDAGRQPVTRQACSAAADAQADTDGRDLEAGGSVGHMAAQPPGPPLPLPTGDSKRSNSSRTASRGISLPEALKDPDSAVFDTAMSRVEGIGRSGYMMLCMLVTFASSGSAVGLWSDMGCGSECLELLQEKHERWSICALILIAIFLLLYLLDFFMPPHLPGKYCMLWDGDRVVGRTLLSVAASAFAAACFLSAKDYPTVPLVITIFLGPIGIMLLRHLTIPKQRFLEERRSHIGNEVDIGFQQRMAILKTLTQEEKDHFQFYTSATAAFVVTALISFAVWVPWAASDARDFDGQMDRSKDRGERELIFVRWSAPMIVGISNLIFAGFVGLRVVLDRAYNATDQAKSKLIIGTSSHVISQDMMEHRLRVLSAQLAVQTHESKMPPEVLLTTQDKVQRYMVQHIEHMRQLSNMVKTVGCALIAMIGALYIAFQLTVADSHIAAMAQGFLGSFFITFLIFIFVSFDRLWHAMGAWLRDLPLWKAALAIIHTDIAHAVAFTILLPTAPLLLLLSATNQCVRRCRGLLPKRTVESGTAAMCRSGYGCVTARFQARIDRMRNWCWVSVVWWCYIIVAAVIIYKMVPVALNALLAWLTSVLNRLKLIWILAGTWVAGMVLFMLPPVPGPPIYLFGGIMIADKPPLGFFWGSVVTICLSFSVKLTACAVQQKIIGEYLGHSKKIRQMCRVHSPFIRAVESVLRKPGLSFGKVMILCGGPDWPVSVLAGILRLSLVQCMIGTLPVIFSVIPLALTGSFYLKREESEVWVRAGNLMFTLTVLVSVLFWAGMGWAIQDEFDKHIEELERPKEEFVELDWMDYCQERIAKRCDVEWADIPRAVRCLYLAGSILLIFVGHIFFWRAKQMLGQFKVTDDIEDLGGIGDKETDVLQKQGARVLAAAALCFLGLVVFACWRRWRSRSMGSEIFRELAAEESAWKECRLALARASVQRTGPAPTMSVEAAKWSMQVCRSLSLESQEPELPATACTVSDISGATELLEQSLGIHPSAARVQRALEELPEANSQQDCVPPAYTSPMEGAGTRSCVNVFLDEETSVDHRIPQRPDVIHGDTVLSQANGMCKCSLSCLDSKTNDHAGQAESHVDGANF